MKMEHVAEIRNQLANKQCVVNLGYMPKRNDFIWVADEQDENNRLRIARIKHIIDQNRAHVIFYLRKNELPPGIELKSDNGSKIKLHKRELIENIVESKNIELTKIIGPCVVFKAKENDSVTDFLQSNSMAYVCRYKLVKKTCYKLVPVDWQIGEEEQQNLGEIYDTDLNTDTEDTNEAVKVPRSRHHISPSNKRASPDNANDNNDVSPNKRNKFSHTPSLESSATRNGTFPSPAPKDMEKCRKNLNDSFTGVEGAFETKIKEDSLKMTFKKVLCEHNSNTETPKQRRSILRTDSAKNTPTNKSTRRVTMVVPPIIDEQSKKVESTPRRSTRVSMLETKNKISATVMNDNSPENEKSKNTRKSTGKAISQPTTPKSVSKRQTTAAKTPHTPQTPKGTTMTPQQTRSLYRSGGLTPSIQSRQEVISGDQTELEMIRERLQVSAVPTSLPCREKEYSSIYEFIIGKLTDGSGGCIYISGVPGTGKTATVTQVIKTIQNKSKPKKVPAFDFVDINGMRLTEPRQAYVQIYRQLTGKTMAWAQARDLLESRFTAGSKKAIRPTVLLVDELDIICNRKQDVVYNLFDWTVRKGSRLIAITIANTMDLPERVLKLKVASRLGLTRITFQPYSFKQLQEVVMTRLAGSNCFMADAVQLVARKVASVSGDCRRALDICRRATEIAEEKSNGVVPVEVNFAHINQALSEMFASPKVRAIKNCTKFEKLFLQAVASEIQRTGIEEVEFHRVFWQIGTLAPILGIKNPPTEDQAMIICMALAANRLLIAEDSSTGLYQKIILNATVDDLYYALNVN
ncbi:origin recognition complex subunit 1 isoform X2 [Contarinia nasturtii]|uniref:origin recognition complex subunit 1 isoform X2 n=1 Tax=Contarinia nasturtii TaxID=265458 RepID=UPI0012D46630|nr:origin recognition complex subunit 1 isoform X2 [Contarinia nasturtii]